MGRRNEYPAKAGEVTGTPRDALARVHGLALLAGVWLRTSLTDISAEVRKVVEH